MKKNSIKRLLRWGIPLLCVVLLFAGWSMYSASQKDKLHGKFYNTGKSINGFLKQYAKALKEDIKEGSPNRLMAFYSSDYHVPGRGVWQHGPAEPVGGVTAYVVEPTGSQDYRKADMQQELQTYLDGIATLDASSRLKIDFIEKVDFGRSVTLKVKYVVGGTEQNGNIFEDRRFLRWHLAKNHGEDGHDWFIVADELVEGVRVTGSGQVFQASDGSSWGIDYEHRRDPKLYIKEHPELRFGVIEHAHGGVSAGDYNSDNRPDLFFVDGVQSRLYRNDTRPGEAMNFTEVTEEVGLDGIDQAVTALFADLDNDGDQDLFVTRYMAPNMVFINEKGHYTDQAAQMGLDTVAPCISATILDYDRDGFLDLYIAVNGNAYETFPRLPFFATNGQPNLLLRNAGGKHFEDVTATAGVGDTGWSLAVASADYDGDGWVDIGVANDFGKKTLYRNKGDGTFEDKTKEAGVLDFSGGMGLTFDDLNNDGLMDIYTSNIQSNQRWFGEDRTINQYIRNVAKTKHGLADFMEYRKLYSLLGSEWINLGQMVGEGNSLFYNNGDGTFTEQKNSHTHQAGWSWGVVAFDMDNDMDQDLYAANGWISNTPGTDL